MLGSPQELLVWSRNVDMKERAECTDIPIWPTHSSIGLPMMLEMSKSPRPRAWEDVVYFGDPFSVRIRVCLLVELLTAGRLVGVTVQLRQSSARRTAGKQPFAPRLIRMVLVE